MVRAIWMVGAVLAAISLRAEAQVAATQRERVFAEKCENCVVSSGSGYSSFEEDCSCFIICEFVGNFKTSTLKSPWVGYKRCCGCGTSFSRSTLTCVDYRSKKSDCFAEVTEAENPCHAPGVMKDDRIEREDPADYDGVLCAGFITCKELIAADGTPTLIPKQECCDDGQCFNPMDETCSAPNCGTVATCTAKRETDDCDCEVPIAEEKECPFMGVDGEDTKYMGVEMMFMYTCPPGTCWDDDLCNCVTANNTGYTDCMAYLTSEFSGSGPAENQIVTTDGRGAMIWNEANGGTLSGGDYSVNEVDYLNVVGTAYNEPGNEFAFRMNFKLTEGGSSSANEVQCVMGNCDVVETESPAESDTIRVTVERDADSTGEEINVFLTYQDTYSMVGNSMSTINLELNGAFSLDTDYVLWVIYCGNHGEERAGAVIYTEDEEETAIDEAEMEVENSQRLIMTQSGFLFGNCAGSGGFEGSFEQIEFYKCKPVDDTRFEEAFGDIFD